MKHNQMGDNLSRAIEAGTTIEALESKKRADDLEGLPQGHPIRVMIEQAKTKFEEERVADERKKEAATKAKVRKRKKATKKKQEHREYKTRDDNRVKVAKTLNKSGSALVTNIISFGKKLDASSDAFEGFPKSEVKIARLKRMLVSVCRGIKEMRLSEKPSVGKDL